MSLCVKGGYTVFGLVKQDYSLPKDVCKKLGYDVYGISDYEYEKYIMENTIMKNINSNIIKKKLLMSLY